MNPLLLLRTAARLNLPPAALARLAAAVRKYGVNLMALLAFAAETYGERPALVDERESYSFRRLHAEADRLAALLIGRYGLAPGRKAAVWCRNHAGLVKAIYAVSATGADLYLLNADLSGEQAARLAAGAKFDLLVHDEEKRGPAERIIRDGMRRVGEQALDAGGGSPAAADRRAPRLRRTSAGRLILLTGGTTTGLGKEAPHRPSLSVYLAPFYAFVSRLNVPARRAAYIAVPLCHGYGLAALLALCAAGRTAIIRRGFDAEQACRLIRAHRAEMAVVVPTMLQRMLRTDPDALVSLSCIASGGAELGPRLVRETHERLGPVLYNLYGTSEAGLALIAAPEDLAAAPNTVGRPIPGVRLRVAGPDGKDLGAGRVGRLQVGRRGARRLGANAWIDTGDLGYRDGRGRYFLCGRADSMIVSGGENVYPLEVEQVLLTHPAIEDAAVIGVVDETFGMRLKAFVQPVRPGAVTEGELRTWLNGKLARYQMPRDIVFVERLPYTPLGKLDRKTLR